MTYDRQTRPMDVHLLEHGVKLDRNEMCMLRLMCGFTLKDRKKNLKLGTETVSL